MQEDFQIVETDITPTVRFSPKEGKFELSGESRPENVSKFYEPIYLWLDNYIESVLDSADEKAKQKVVNFKFTYFNSTSAKCILFLLNKFEKLFKNGHNVQINWYYDQPDLDMKDSGEEYAKLCTMPCFLYEVVEG